MMVARRGMPGMCRPEARPVLSAIARMATEEVCGVIGWQDRAFRKGRTPACAMAYNPFSPTVSQFRGRLRRIEGHRRRREYTHPSRSETLF